MNTKSEFEEKKYLENYSMNGFERPSLATDIAIFSIMREQEQLNIRKLQKKALKVLLIKRASLPYKDYWALPGGFCLREEDVIDTAKRELYEETNIHNAYLQFVGAFGAKGRDPRGWIISNAFMALLDGELSNLKASTDAWEACWFSMQIHKKEIERVTKKDSICILTEYSISLLNNEKDLEINIILHEKKVFQNYHETIQFEIIKSDLLAFDHAKIILTAYLFLKDNVEKDTKIIFDLLPEVFTLSQLQNALEIILGKKLLPANFRRKISEYVIETEKIVENVGYRPAKLYRRNISAFYKE
ncbi:MAG: NUDIX domain-containing protein [Aminipila sp.]